MSSNHSFRLLFLLPTSPLPIFSGGRLRMYHVLRTLSRRHQITVLSFWRDEEARSGLDQLAGQLDVEVVAVPFARLRNPGDIPAALMRRLRSPLSDLPSDVVTWEQPGMYKALERTLAAKPFDVIQVEWSYLAPYALKFPHIPSVLIEHDVFSVAYARRASLAAGGRHRRTLQRQAVLWERYERTIYPRFSAVGAMSAADAIIARQLAPAANIVVLPNGVDTKTLTPAGVRPQVRRLLFVGAPTHDPNLDAACWLLSDIWPELHRRHPELLLTLVNLRHPRVEALMQPGVEITARLPDLVPVYREADIALAPLRAGSGTRLKILEAFALGVPVISTSIGHEGLEVTPGIHLLSADTPPDFITAIERLLPDRAERQRLAEHARALVVERYDWDRVAALHEELYCQLVEPAD